jgi:hypothetical protein
MLLSALNFNSQFIGVQENTFQRNDEIGIPETIDSYKSSEKDGFVIVISYQCKNFIFNRKQTSIS